MATNRRYATGQHIPVVCSHPTTPASGKPVRVGALVGVAETNERTDGTTTVDLGPAVYALSVKGVNDTGNVAVAVGDPLYYVDADVGTGTGFLSKKDSGRYAGIALEAVDSAATTTVNVLIGSGSGVGQANLPAGFLNVDLAAGGAAGNITITGVAVGDELVFVGVFTTAASIATLADLTAEFSITAGNTINNTGGTATTNNQLMVIWVDRT
jgi:hypothetical protein